jgi:hypothetical protein
MKKQQLNNNNNNNIVEQDDEYIISIPLPVKRVSSDKLPPNIECIFDPDNEKTKKKKRSKKEVKK